MRNPWVLLILGAWLAFAGPAGAEPEVTDAALRQRMEELAASTLVGGAGWRVYESLLHPDYSRWAVGEAYEGREKFLENLRGWWDYGMRVASRDVETVGVDLTGDVAIIRFVTRETFTGPEGDAGGFTGHVTNVWLREQGDWKLLSAEIVAAKPPAE